MHQRWLNSIPETIEWEDDVPTEMMEEIEKLHTRLKTAATTNDRRRAQLAEKGIVLDVRNEVNVRMSLLVDMFIGTLSPERLHFELEWQRVISASMEDAAAAHAEMERERRESKNLHLPGGRVHKVKPENSDG